jgi:dTMP kinase
MGIPTILTKEPGGTSLGKGVRSWLKFKGKAIPSSELLLFAASRAQLTSEVIQPALERGEIVISDRFSDSTVAYQGYGRGLDLNLIKAVNDAATAGLRPDLIILLDIEVETGLGRKLSEKDRFEQEELDFHRRVRQGYLKMAAQDPECWFVVDASLSKAEVTKIIWERVKQLLSLQQP